MPIPTEPVKRVCYADDLTVWASGVNIPDLEVSINNYLGEITAYLKDNSILEYSSRIHTCHWLNAQGYWGSIWTPPYHSTSTTSMWQREYQVGTTSLRPSCRYFMGTKGNTTDDLSITPHLFGVQTYMTPTTEKSNTHRTRLWGSLRDVTRCPV